MPIQRALPAVAEALRAARDIVGEDARHPDILSVIVEAHKIVHRLGIFKEADPLAPVAQPRVIHALIDRPGDHVIGRGGRVARAGEPAVPGRMDGDPRGIENELGLRRGQVLRAGRQRRVHPKFIVDGGGGGIFQSRRHIQRRAVGGEEERDLGPQPIRRIGIAHRHRHAPRRGERLPCPGHAPLVAVLLHRQTPLDPASSQPPALLRRPPTGGLDHRVLIEMILARGLVDDLIDAPAQRGEQRHRQVLVLHHQQFVGDGDRRRRRLLVARPIQHRVSDVVGGIEGCRQVLSVRISRNDYRRRIELRRLRGCNHARFGDHIRRWGRQGRGPLRQPQAQPQHSEQHQPQHPNHAPVSHRQTSCLTFLILAPNFTDTLIMSNFPRGKITVRLKSRRVLKSLDK